MDGQIEKMQLHTLDTLLREDTWGRQVMIIQGYVPTVSIQTGNYSHAPQVRFFLFFSAFHLFNHNLALSSSSSSILF